MPDDVKAELYLRILDTTGQLIQLMTDFDEDTGDLPAFYEKIQKKYLKLENHA